MLRLSTLDKNVDRGYFGELNSHRDVVAWCYSNTFHIVDPVVRPKYWHLNQLPFFPGLDDVVPSSPEAAEKLREVVDMMRVAETVICAMEPTNDGQLLFHDLLTYAREHLNVNIPESKVFRIWLHVRNREAIRSALKSPFPNERFKHLAKSAYTRRYIDWCAQYNYSKLYTLLYSRHSSQIFQMGRISLLLLKQVTERYLERREFKPKAAFEVHLDCVVHGYAVVFKWTKDTSNLVPYDAPLVPESPSSSSSSSSSSSQTNNNRRNSNRNVGNTNRGNIINNNTMKTMETEAATIDRPQPFHRRSASFRHNSTNSKQEAIAISEGLESISTIVATRTENVHQPPPLLYNLTSIQREAYERYSIVGSATHVALLSLYEKFGLITNPNTSSHQVPPPQAEQLEETFRYFSGLRKYSAYTRNDCLASRIGAQDPRIFNPTMASHETHAIIPIVSSLSNAKRDAFMSPTMAIIYDMVVRRFLAAMMPDMVHSVITVTLENADKYYFEAKAATLKSEGWKSIGAPPKAKAPFNPGPPNYPTGYIPSTTGEDEEAALEDIIEQKTLYKILSQLRMGDELKGVVPAAVVTKETSPPPLFTQSRVMALMEDKAALVDNTLTYEAGLGMPEARADILTRLMAAKWFRTRQDRYLEPTRKGILLTKLIQDDAITDPVHSHSWDHTLSRIAQGKGFSSALIKRFKAVVEPDISKHIITGDLGMYVPHLDVAYDLIFYHTNAPAARLLNEAPFLSSTRCPKCKAKGHIKQGPSAYFCAAPRCNFTMPQIVDQHLITLEEAKTLLQRKPTPTISGLIDSLGDTYDATLSLQPQHYNIQISNKVVTKKAESQSSSKINDNPLAMRRRRALSESLGQPRMVSALNGPGSPKRGTKVVKAPQPRGRPRVPEDVVAARIKFKVDRQLTKSIAKQAKSERDRQRRMNLTAAPDFRIDAAGNPVKRLGRPRIGEIILKKPSKPRGRPKLSAEEIKRRKKLKLPPGRPPKASVLAKQRQEVLAENKAS